MNKKPTTMLLEANFDIDQVSDVLEWRFSRKDGNGNPITGKYAGGIYFTVGEEMRFRVQAGSWNRLKSFQILDCTLITMPQIVLIGPNIPAQYAPPSPFVDNKCIDITGASVNLPAADFVMAEVKPVDPDYHELAVRWDKHLTVGDGVGRWEISFYVTVQVERDDGHVYTRVFGFDPEGEVGNGMSPPK